MDRTVTWRSAVVLAVGTALLVTVSLGPMAAELGNVSWVVWSLTAIIGAVQCFLIARLASGAPDRAGGTATYAHLALAKHSPFLAGLSSWAYWFAWTPGIAVNAILASAYLSEAINIHGGLPLTLGLVTLLYVINYFGLRTSVPIYVGVAVVAVALLVAILIGALLQPSELDMGNVLQLSVPGGDLLTFATLALVLKWAFVAVWSSYGAEIASTIVAEMKEPLRNVGRAMTVAAITGVVAFTVVPVVLLAIAGPEGLRDDPAVVFLGPARELFGEGGARVVAVMLTAGLLLGAQAFIIGSSRTVYQLARDGHMPRIFGKVNRYGVPIGSLTWDVVVILGLLAVFGTGVTDIVASANIGYLVVFVLLPLTYLVMQRSQGQLSRAADLLRLHHLAAALLVLFNSVLLIAGGPQWGLTVMITGVAVLFLIVPLQWASRRTRPAASPLGTSS